ncbi:MAG: MFS transporter [Lachnospiraceae bacterium]|nr:MFS transporter [Lachnospiraceae bacterium]
MKSIRNHPLINVLRNNKGNTRTQILMEPLWGIPFNLIAPFATLYMYTQGITDVQIGLILSVSMVMQVICSFFGGIITDRFGRKHTTMMGDLLGWVIACLIWAFSNNFWLFLIAALFNSIDKVNWTAWFCLLIEDADSKDLVGVYSWTHIAGLVAVFFAPISGLLIFHYSLVPVVRVLYLIFAINMSVKIFITYRCCTETKRGKIRMEETKNTSIITMLNEYKILIPSILKNREIMKVIAISVILHVSYVISSSFFGLYITQRLGVNQGYLAFFPILNAIVMLIFMVGIQHRLDSMKFRIPMWSGLIINALCTVLLIFTPVSLSIPFIIVHVFFGAIAVAIVVPRKDALLQLNINPEERARINALITTFTIAFASPFGYLAGWLSSIDRRLPFVFILIIILIAIIIVGRIQDPKFAEEQS